MRIITVTIENGVVPDEPLPQDSIANKFDGEKYGNWRDLNGNLGILPPVYWLNLPAPPSE